MVCRHYRLNGYEFGQTLGDGEGQESLMWYSPWGRKELDITECQQQHCSPYSLNDQKASPCSPLELLGFTYFETPASLGDKMKRTPDGG